MSTQEFDFAPAWRPEVGDVVEGEIVTLDNGYSNYGQYPIVTLRLADGSEVAIHAFHSALRNRLMDVKPSIGNTLAVKYFGEVDNKKGDQKYYKYGVRSNAKQADFWGAAETPSPIAPPRGAVLPSEQEADDGMDVPF